jgi:hypothetical protein
LALAHVVVEGGRPDRIAQRFGPNGDEMLEVVEPDVGFEPGARAGVRLEGDHRRAAGRGHQAVEPDVRADVEKDVSGRQLLRPPAHDGAVVVLPEDLLLDVIAQIELETQRIRSDFQRVLRHEPARRLVRDELASAQPGCVVPDGAVEGAGDGVPQRHGRSW